MSQITHEAVYVTMKLLPYFFVGIDQVISFIAGDYCIRWHLEHGSLGVNYGYELSCGASVTSLDNEES